MNADPQIPEHSSRSHPDCDHPHVDVLGVNVSAVNLSRAIELAESWIARKIPGYVCVTGVHGIMEAQRDTEFCHTLNRAVLNTPDGMPLSWIGRLQGFRQMDRVFGPDLMSEVCQRSVSCGYRHFLYGGQPGVAEHLKNVLQDRFPGLQVVGTWTPPFRALNSQEERDLVAQVHACSPDVLWVGISTPRQEQFMAQYVERLRVPLVIGVGAAFDYHTGRIHDSPRWVKRAGLQWLHRLMQDPRRLWRRYLRNNPAFVWKVIRQLLRKFSSRTSEQPRDN